MTDFNAGGPHTTAPPKVDQYGLITDRNHWINKNCKDCRGRGVVYMVTNKGTVPKPCTCAQRRYDRAYKFAEQKAFRTKQRELIK